MLLTAYVVLTYPVMIQHRRGGLWRLLVVPGLLTYGANVLANYTELALVFGWPERGEHTITQRLRRMQRHALRQSQRDLAHWLLTYREAVQPELPTSRDLS